jgi:hypothetical protein
METEIFSEYKDNYALELALTGSRLVRAVRICRMLERDDVEEGPKSTKPEYPSLDTSRLMSSTTLHPSIAWSTRSVLQSERNTCKIIAVWHISENVRGEHESE